MSIINDASKVATKIEDTRQIVGEIAEWRLIQQALTFALKTGDAKPLRAHLENVRASLMDAVDAIDDAMREIKL